MSSAKRAQKKHKKNWKAQANLLDVLSNDIMRKAKKTSKNFLSLVTDYLQFVEQQTLNCYDIGLKIFEIQCVPAACRNAATSEQAMVS